MHICLIIHLSFTKIGTEWHFIRSPPIFKLFVSNYPWKLWLGAMLGLKFPWFPVQVLEGNTGVVYVDTLTDFFWQNPPTPRRRISTRIFQIRIKQYKWYLTYKYFQSLYVINETYIIIIIYNNSALKRQWTCLPFLHNIRYHLTDLTSLTWINTYDFSHWTISLYW